MAITHRPFAAFIILIFFASAASAGKVVRDGFCEGTVGAWTVSLAVGASSLDDDSFVATLTLVDRDGTRLVKVNGPGFAWFAGGPNDLDGRRHWVGPKLMYDFTAVYAKGEWRHGAYGPPNAGNGLATMRLPIFEYPYKGELQNIEATDVARRVLNRRNGLTYAYFGLGVWAKPQRCESRACAGNFAADGHSIEIPLDLDDLRDAGYGLERCAINGYWFTAIR